ncbi:Fic family protein [Iamia sp.]|uniref:Fic family protein n=1 Tax=Iamia sp. TaxID=2722710 RepID=UPI002B96A9FA|nr:Fic family protein [Iamia sp.]HXH58569.1 Fic family protein [Iamia sp.]
MPGPSWSDDDHTDQATIVANVAVALTAAFALADARTMPAARDVKAWHSSIYDGCAVPSPSYVGHFRGDPGLPDIVDYEVAVGSVLVDGLPERVGVWADDVAAAVDQFFDGLAAALAVLDDALPPGDQPTQVDALDEVIALAAEVHGEWVRIHPFANGNGRTARLLVAHISYRYGLPIFLALKPHPDDVAYARASKASMGRPPDFAGDHGEARAVFAYLLTLHLLS